MGFAGGGGGRPPRKKPLLSCGFGKRVIETWAMPLCGPPALNSGWTAECFRIVGCETGK